MSLPQHARAVVEAAVGAGVVAASPVSGGDINDAWCVDVAGGLRVFCKTNPAAPPDMFAAEARGLDWLRTPHGAAVPEVVAHDAHCLVLGWVDQGWAGDREESGVHLAITHGSLPEGHGPGLDHGNYIGRLPQDNRPEPTWAQFYRDRRLWPQARLAKDTLGASLLDRISRICDTLPRRLGAPEPLARLHGDLWSGNLLVDQAGTAWLVDPAVAAGHREQDLAMLGLFGGLGPKGLAGYQQVWPLQPGWKQRLPLYELYYLLVHVNLFGAGWLPRVRMAVRAVETGTG